ncbi:nitroreductase family protein [Pseudoflavonifractor sp. MSJ-37]|uniref:nitroreductase family protein n=1 Tax=Pseudoflavonifractor sp. MSJ-37 TaxID=2841531 RepID=UPI001C10D807|nr:nitroreductase family protein [Pseudoflavonifractor sp. MSJ-37]MBU5434732.1 nitroreductase family protein [Pseudoflavonifractor sp. MSJ-37]
MELQECIKTRRSIRKFTDEPIPRTLLEQAVALAAWAPSWKNTQISRYIAIEDPEMRKTICETYASFNARIIGGCKTLIAQTFVKGRSGFERDSSFSTDRDAGWQYYDCGIAAQTFCLAAHDLGLGTVIMGIFDRKGLESYLQIPEDQELMALIAVGYPAEEPTGPKRKDVETLLTYR